MFLILPFKSKKLTYDLLETHTLVWRFYLFNSLTLETIEYAYQFCRALEYATLYGSLDNVP